MNSEHLIAQTIIDYFNQLDQGVAKKKPYRAFRQSDPIFPTQQVEIQWIGYCFIGIAINKNMVHAYDFLSGKWYKLCQIENPEFYQIIRNYIDQHRGGL